MGRLKGAGTVKVQLSQKPDFTDTGHMAQNSYGSNYHMAQIYIAQNSFGSNFIWLKIRSAQISFGSNLSQMNFEPSEF